MKKLLCTLFISAAPGLLGCGVMGSPGEAGPPGEKGLPGEKGEPGVSPTLPASLVSVTPTTIFAERSALVQIGGVGTHFGAGTRVLFDDAALVPGKLQVGGPGYLQVAVQVNPGARFGAHDVTVESSIGDPAQGGMRESVSLKGVLSVAGTLAADAGATSKSVPQGGLVDFSLRNLDRENAFAGTLKLDGGARPLWLSPFGGRIVGYGLVDTLAPVGGLGLHATTDSGGQKLGYALDPQADNAPQVTARTATALTLGTALAGEKIAMPRQANLYKLTSTADAQILWLYFTVSGGLLSSTLVGAVAPSSGRFADGQIFYASTNMAAQTALALLPSKGDAYVSVLPASLGGGGDFAYSIVARAAAGKSVSVKEPSPPDAPGMPLLDVVLDAPRYAQDGALDGPADVDYLRIKTPKAGRLYVQATTPGASLSPSTVSVTLLQADCMTGLAPQRSVQQEAAVAADGIYCAVLASPAGYVGPYQLVIAQDP